MKYELLHLENDLDRQKKALLSDVEASILALDSFQDIVTDIESECEFHSDCSGYNFILSAFPEDKQLRIAENLNSDDFLVLILHQD